MSADKAQPTPGPWRVVEHSWGEASIYGPDGAALMGASIVDEATEENQDELSARMTANLRLSAAAPDLRAALEALRIDANRLCDRNLGGTYEADCRRSIALADAALAKAGVR